MKKLVVLFLTLAMTVSLASCEGCGGSGADEASGAAQTVMGEDCH